MSKSSSAQDSAGSLDLENLSVFPEETNQQAYERLRKIFCVEIGTGNSEDLAKVVNELSETKHGNVIISAYMSACARLNCLVKNVETELKVMTLPIMIRSSSLSSIPSEIDQITSAEIQRIVDKELHEKGFPNVLVIPTNRLLSCYEYENEHPHTMHEILKGVADAINSTPPDLKHNYVAMPKVDDINSSDDNLIYDGKTYVTCRLMPYIVIQKTSDKKRIQTLGSRVTLNRIARTLEMSCEGMIEGNLDVTDAQVIAPNIYAYVMDNPFLSTALIQSQICLEKLYFDVAQFIDGSKKDNVMAALLYAPLVGVLTIDVSKIEEDGNRVNAEFSFLVKHSHRSYEDIERVVSSLVHLGVGLVTAEILDNMQNVPIISHSLH